jgi:hypothetical protein
MLATATGQKGQPFLDKKIFRGLPELNRAQRTTMGMGECE